ncbi:methionine biosynthesis protein MetW [Psychrobacter sp. TAE2020]|uniref:methionine biosynthesis protein MetW n=1 Tax=Psychrobacter sp. TAE2020 TaxID=2846762 RepID=UPI001C0F6F47|nr:methionine biosynthesis protein MetW [Psychrobacter sp. TAE2020]MBU5616680.1 methionine biosynthesis protein MetW [Psychrobacter sp. TAE2020]
MRMDHQLAERWIAPQSHVLDLGCGNGELLAHLQHKLGVSGYGLEIDEDKINEAIANGLSIVEQDLNDGLGRFADNSFDTVVMARALQAVKAPDELLLDMLRVGREAIITFPNFAHWQNRLHLGLKGMMPVSEALPYEWYDTPNIHLCTFKDFEKLCAQQGIDIINRFAVSDSDRGHSPLMTTLIRQAPNLLADVAIYRVTKRHN